MRRTSICNRLSALTAASLLILGIHPAALCQEIAVQSDFEHKVILYNVNGSPLLNPEADLKGNPYFLKDWKYAAVFTARNETFTHVQVRLDLQRQLLHFVNSVKTELVAAAGAVKEVIIFDTTAGVATAFDFRCGYPAIDNQNETNYYLVLTSGKITLLKSLRKSVLVEHDEFSGDTDKEITLYEEYYFFNGSKMERVKRDKSFVLGKLKDKKAEMEIFIQTNKLSFKSFDEIRKEVEYYNSIP